MAAGAARHHAGVRCLALLAPVVLGAADWRADASFLTDVFTGGRADEHAVDLSLARRCSGGWTPVGAVSYQQRFATDDTRAEAWLFTPGFGPGYAWAMLGVTPDAEFLANEQAEVGSEAEWGGTIPSLRVRWLRYGSEQIGVAMLATQQHAVGPLWLDGGLAGSVSDEQPAVASWQAGARWRAEHLPELRGFVASGRENDPPLPIVEFLTIGGTLLVPLGHGWAARSDATWMHRVDLYDQTSISISLTARF